MTLQPPLLVLSVKLNFFLISEIFCLNKKLAEIEVSLGGGGIPSYMQRKNILPV